MKILITKQRMNSLCFFGSFFHIVNKHKSFKSSLTIWTPKMSWFKRSGSLEAQFKSCSLVHLSYDLCGYESKFMRAGALQKCIQLILLACCQVLSVSAILFFRIKKNENEGQNPGQNGNNMKRQNTKFVGILQGHIQQKRTSAIFFREVFSLTRAQVQRNK